MIAPHYCGFETCYEQKIFHVRKPYSWLTESLQFLFINNMRDTWGLPSLFKLENHHKVYNVLSTVFCFEYFD